MNIQQIPLPLVESAWFLSQQMLSKVIEHSMGYFNMEELHRSVASGERKIIVAMSGLELAGVLLVRYQIVKDETIAWVTALAGNCFFSKLGWDKVKAILKANGATRVEAVMRPSMVRLCNKVGIGFTEKYRAYGAPL